MQNVKQVAREINEVSAFGLPARQKACATGIESNDYEFWLNLLTRAKLAADPAVASQEARGGAEDAASAELADGGRVSKSSATASQTK